MSNDPTNTPTPESTPQPAAPADPPGAITVFEAIIKDVNAGEVLATGAIALIVKLKGILSNHSDITVDIQGLNADAMAQYATELAEANAWLKARNYPEVQG